MITNKVQPTYQVIAHDNPFPGLRAFGVDESHLFFGREGQSEIVLEYLAEHRFAAVTGASGSGKSSLIYCGVVPILYGGFITGAGSDWRIIATRPGNQPVLNLAEAIADSESVKKNVDEAQRQLNQKIVYALMRRSQFGLIEAVSQIGLEKGENLLLIIDQFEELFRFKDSRENTLTTLNETEAFIKLLVNAIHQRKLPIFIVLTMRSDFIGECSQFQDLTALINDSNFLVPQMTREDFSRAILGPIEVAGQEMDPQLYQEILNSITEGSDQLPVLQHSLMRTWEFWKKYNEPGTHLRLRDYEASGKMENALSMHANEAYEELTEDGKEICRSMFKTLTEKSGDNKGIRHPATVKEIAEIAQANYESVMEVINAFRTRGRSFLTPAENIPLTEHTVIDISHESLMRVWDRLKGWVEEETNSVQMYMRLSEAASMYQLGKTGLWRPPDLHLALNWKRTQKPTLAWAKKYNPAFEKVMVFLDASEKKFNQEEQNKIKLQKRTLSRTRRFALTMIIAAFLFLILGIYANRQRKLANEGRRFAEAYAQNMEIEKNLAVEERDYSEYEALLAQLARDSAELAERQAILQLREVEVEAQEAYQIASTERQRSQEFQRSSQHAQQQRELAERTADQALEERERAEAAKAVELRKRMLTTAQTMAIKATQMEDIDLKGLLAYQAYIFNDQYGGIQNHPDIYQGLYSAYAAYRGDKFNSMKGHEGSVKSLAFLPSRRVFYSSGADGKILRWDLDRSGARPQVLINNNFSNRSLAISSNGRWLACGTGTSSIQVFNLNQSNAEPELLQGHQGAVVDLDFIDGKDILISMGSDKSLISWNLLSGASKTIVTHSSRIRVISISKDGRYVYGGTDDGKLIRWTISNGESRMIYDNRNTSIHTLALNRNGSRIVLGDKSGNIIVLDPNAGRVISRVKGHSSRVLDISYSPDNTQLASSSMDGTIKIWNARDLSESPIVLTAHESWVFAIAFSPDGRSIVSSSENGDIFFWSSRTKYLADEMCNVISRNFTDQEWDIYVGMDVNYQKTCANK